MLKNKDLLIAGNWKMNGSKKNLSMISLLMKYIKQKKFKNSEMIYKKGFYLPCGIGITNKEIFTVCKVLKKILN